MKQQRGTGIYIAYPTSSVLKSIYRPKNYKTQVNDQHTKVGIAKNSFSARNRGYVGNFDAEVEFVPIAVVPLLHLEKAEKAVIAAIRREYKTVGRAREWFLTADRVRVKQIVLDTLNAIQCPHERIG